MWEFFLLEPVLFQDGFVFYSPVAFLLFLHKRKEFKADSFTLWTFLRVLQRLSYGPWSCYSHESGSVAPLAGHLLTPLPVF